MKGTDKAGKANAVYRPHTPCSRENPVIHRTVARRTDHCGVKSEDGFADGGSTGPASLYQLRNLTMTLTTTKSSTPVAAHTLQQHHQQAGEHLQQAAASHLAAAKSHGAGDHKAATQQAQIASDHTAHAQQHVSQAEKLAAPGSVAQAPKAH